MWYIDRNLIIVNYRSLVTIFINTLVFFSVWIGICVLQYRLGWVFTLWPMGQPWTATWTHSRCNSITSFPGREIVLWIHPPPPRQLPIPLQMSYHRCNTTDYILLWGKTLQRQWKFIDFNALLWCRPILKIQWALQVDAEGGGAAVQVMHHC